MSLSSFSDVQEHFAELFGRAAALYNLNPLLGRLYGYLILAPEPVTLNDLVHTTGSAKSTVSVAVRSLERYRLVRRHWVKGDRRDFFTVRMDVNAILQELFHLYFSPELNYMRDASKAARMALVTADSDSDDASHSPDTSDWPDPEERQILLNRVDTLENFLGTISSMLEQLLQADQEPGSSTETIHIEVEE